VLLILAVVSPATSFGGSHGGSHRCLGCHGREDLAVLRNGVKVSLTVDHAALEMSAHSGAKCEGCHSDVTAIPHIKRPEKVRCGICHEEEAKNYGESIHGIARRKGRKGVPRCTTCHGTHGILPVNNPESRAFSLNIVKVCLKCHEDRQLEVKYNLPGVLFFKAYKNSIHGQAIRKAGLNVAPACPDCHGNHKILAADNPDSQVNKLRIPSSCGKCHPGIERKYEKSVHGKGLRAGIMDSPVCTSCHGEHTIAKITDPTSKVYFKNIPRTCGSCHGSKIITSRYALPKNRLSTYEESFHGIALEYGMTKAANCASCHGFHLILPSSDPASSINKANIPKTCGKCHPKASRNFARGTVHVEVSREGNVGAWMVRIFYTGFIGILVLIFLIHIGFDIAERERHKKLEKQKDEEGRQ